MKQFQRQLLGLAAAALVASASGCDSGTQPNFKLNMLQVSSNELHPDYGVEIASVLDAVFGTPDAPVAPPDSGLDQKLLNLAAGPAWTDSDSVTHGLYRRHCVHCHGISGDGRGPTAAFLDPYPRDYRKGVFKFKSTYAAERPTNDDLVRVLHNGIPGTSMPSFSLLPRPEVDALVEYVKYLAMRGELETRIVAYVSEELGVEDVEDENGDPVEDEDGNPKTNRLVLDPSQNPDQADVVKEELTTIVESWAAAADAVIIPAEDQAPSEDRSADDLAQSINEGRVLFYGAKANCLKCHGPTALGDGEQADFDSWMRDLEDFSKVTAQLAQSIEDRQNADPPESESEKDRDDRLAALDRDVERLAERDRVYATMLRKRNAIPRNLRQGVYRGGRRRLDVFYRIHAGIPGSPMPGVGGTTPGAAGTVTEEEIWKIVDYVQSLPYEPESGPDEPRAVNNMQVTR
jgi:mono/diheme cytochrome c family protein